MKVRTDEESGFTIIEILVVVAIIGIITAIATPKLIDGLNRARQSKTMTTMRGYGVELERYAIDHDEYPAVDNIYDLRETLGSHRLPLTDGWNHPLDYLTVMEPMKAKKPKSPESGGSGRGNYMLESFGQDGIDGGNITPGTRHIYELDIVFENGSFSSSTH